RPAEGWALRSRGNLSGIVPLKVPTPAVARPRGAACRKMSGGAGRPCATRVLRGSASGPRRSSMLPFLSFSTARRTSSEAVRRRAPRVALSLVGTGQVGGALLRQLAEHNGRVAGPSLVGVANSRRSLADAAGIAPDDALTRLWSEGGEPGLEAPLAA